MISLGPRGIERHPGIGERLHGPRRLLRAHVEDLDDGVPGLGRHERRADRSDRAHVHVVAVAREREVPVLLRSGRPGTGRAGSRAGPSTSPVPGARPVLYWIVNSILAAITGEDPSFGEKMGYYGAPGIPRSLLFPR
jgi:hypothetical protein